MDAFTTTFFADVYGIAPPTNTSGGPSPQGQLSSAYTAWLQEALTTPEGAEWVAFLAWQQLGSVSDAVAIRTALEAAAQDPSSLVLIDLFGAAQSKTGAVNDLSVSDPEPKLVINGFTIELSAMLGRLDTETWQTTLAAGKKTETIYHTREFFTETTAPSDYDSEWDYVGPSPSPNTAPDAVDDLGLSILEDDTTGAVGNVLSNDSDLEDGAPVVKSFTVEGTTYDAGQTATLLNGAELTVEADGTVTLIQNGAYNGLSGTGSAEIQFSYTVEDTGALTDSANAKITINGVEDCTTVANPITDKLVNETESLIFSIPAGTFADPDTAISNYTAQLDTGAPLPSWIVFNDSTLTFTVTAPDHAADTDYNIVVSAEGSNQVSDTFTLTVKTDPTDAVPSGSTFSGSDFTDPNGNNSLIIGSDDPNTIDAGNQNDTVYGAGGNDIILGGAGADVLYAGSGGDRVEGGNGSDTLYGGSGSDTLIGGNGADQLWGGFGADAFRFAPGDSTQLAMDTIGDFQSGLDQIQLTGFSGLSIQGSIADLSALSANSVAWYTVGTDTYVVADTNNTPAQAELMIKVASATLANGDVILI